MRAAVLALLVVGCGYVPRPSIVAIDSCPGTAADLCGEAWKKLPLQELAERVVWTFSWEMRTPLPEVRHLSGSALNCGYGQHGSGFWVLTGFGQQLCVRGVYWPSRRIAYVAAEQGDATPIHRTSLVHELNHARLHDIGGNDGEHTDPSWRAGGLVDLTNSVVAAILYGPKQ
jgi:hypothetical protein